jgi:glycosyltransferase involved in cell wall biosynthesis
VRLLCPMTYYRPYVSGPIIYVERLGSELVRRGHEVTFLTSWHDRSTPREEMWEGIRVVRVPVAARVSKGVLMPRLPFIAWDLIRRHDAVLIQCPQFDAPVLAWLARMAGRPSVITYHCDVQLPPGLMNRAVNGTVSGVTKLAARRADRIVAYTRDYATHSPVMSRHLDKVDVIPPPVEMPMPGAAEVAALRERFGLHGRKVIGICGRMSAEKGFENLLRALPVIEREFPGVSVLHAGETEAVIGETAYRQRLQPLLAQQGERWISMGVLGGADLAAFFAACDVTVLPSLNRTESFGLVQVESMLCGTPVVASALPGVRVPTQTTGMGLTATPGDVDSLAEALLRVLREPEQFQRPRREIERLYSTTGTADGYEKLLSGLVS